MQNTAEDEVRKLFVERCENCTIVHLPEKEDEGVSKDIKSESRSSQWIKRWNPNESICYVHTMDKTIISNGRLANSFIEAAVQAYNSHTNLALSPEIIHTLLISILSLVVRDNSEFFRKTFVCHESKKDIIVYTEPVFCWEKDVITKLANEVKKNVHQEQIQKMCPSFSTSTAVSNLCNDVALLSTLQDYFQLKVNTRCHIGKFKFFGTIADWNLLYTNWCLLLDCVKEKIPVEIYDNLKYVLEQFKNAVEGNANADFFENFMNVHDYKVSFKPYLTGYIRYLVPYDENGLCTNTKRELTSFPPLVFKTPFEWEIDGEKVVNSMYMKAGLMGVEKHSDNFFFPIYNLYIASANSSQNLRYIEIPDIIRLPNKSGRRRSNIDNYTKKQLIHGVEKLAAEFSISPKELLYSDNKEYKIALLKMAKKFRINIRTLKRILKQKDVILFENGEKVSNQYTHT